MNEKETPERCPLCGEAAAVRPKLLLINEAWVRAPGKDPRLAYFADLRVDDVKAELLSDPPLEQFIQGHFCEQCGRGFVSEEVLKETHRRYR